mmetsp:Transcript_25168/g.63326  ORF Transcript_25168/g.63326 Transcript_25168/m.63326 type:complete len:207 (+) Transcript_25168:2691-3311(+)
MSPALVPVWDFTFPRTALKSGRRLTSTASATFARFLSGWECGPSGREWPHLSSKPLGPKGDCWGAVNSNVHPLPLPPSGPARSVAKQCTGRSAATSEHSCTKVAATHAAADRRTMRDYLVLSRLPTGLALAATGLDRVENVSSSRRTAASPPRPRSFTSTTASSLLGGVVQAEPYSLVSGVLMCESDQSSIAANASASPSLSLFYG